MGTYDTRRISHSAAFTGRGYGGRPARGQQHIQVHGTGRGRGGLLVSTGAGNLVIWKNPRTSGVRSAETQKIMAAARNYNDNLPSGPLRDPYP